MSKNESLIQYGTSFQSKIISSLLTDVKFTKQIIDILDVSYFDTDSNKQSSEKVFQKLNMNINDKDYKVFTKQFDEIEKAEFLETNEEIINVIKNYLNYFFNQKIFPKKIISKNI